MTKHIYAPAETPHGAQASVHRIAGVQHTPEAALVTLNSYADAEKELILWQDRYPISMEQFGTLTYPDGVLAWAVSPAGWFPSGELVDDPTTLEAEKARLAATVTHRRDMLIGGGYAVAGFGRFDTDDKSIRNIQGAVQAAALATSNEQAFSIGWRLADNSMVTLDAAQMIAVGQTIALFIDDVYQHSFALKDAIDAAEDADALAEIDIYSGWSLSEPVEA